MEKITLWDLSERKDWETAVVVFKEESFKHPYSLEERSYRISCKNNYFNPEMISTALWGDCLDGKDNAVRLDYYIPDWKVDYCYIEK